VLAAPIAGVGGSPRLTHLLVNEGDRVREGQLLARFDTGPTLEAERRLIGARLANLARRLRVQQRELNRYRQLTTAGALSADELDRREQQYLQLLGERMEALLEVYESDIDRVRPGQSVLLTSENGGFEGTLKGNVLRISPQVRQREVLSTDPSGDVDARIVEVSVGLAPEDAWRVRALTGLKVIARLQP